MNTPSAVTSGDARAPDARAAAPRVSTPTATHPAAAGTGTAGAARRVVDAPVRMFHWLFAASFALAYVTAESERWRAMHVTLGYTMGGLLVARLLYGLFGPRPARLGPTLRALGDLPAWLREMVARPTLAPAPWRRAQRIATAGTAIALLAATVPLVASGFGAWQEWGGELLAELHEALGEGMLVLVAAHVAVIALIGLLRRRNSVRPMLDGRIDGAGPDLVRADRRWLAALLLIAVLGFDAWSLSGGPPGAARATDGAPTMSSAAPPQVGNS
jgi:cytochrome b